MAEKLEEFEELLEWGGPKKTIVLLCVSGLALVSSFLGVPGLPFDPALIAIVLCGIPIAIEAIIGLVTKFDITANVLVTIALIASIVLGEYFAAGEVALIMQLGELLEELTVDHARSGIERLVALTPQTARVVDADGAEREVPAQDVVVGQTVRVLPGETIPIDGCIVAGITSIDESVVTGESLPVDKQPGDHVSSGTVNQFGTIDCIAERVGEDSTIQRMAALVQSADADKSRIVRLVDRWAAWIVVAALAAAIGVYFATGEILRSVTILVVFCPCSLVLSTPTAMMAGIGNATRHGFLVKEGDALERLASATRIAFDKTGTLTRGIPQLKACEPVPESAFTAPELFALVAGAELRSEHPLGRAVVDAARADGSFAIPEPESFQMVPGQGVITNVDGHEIVAGNRMLMESHGLTLDAWDDAQTDALLNQGCTVTYVAVDGHAAGILALADTLRDEARKTVEGIRELGAEPLLLTGDNEAAAAEIARQTGIDDVMAQCRPEDKLRYIENAEERGEKIAMVGDGINDAPALKRAYAGIAMGGVGSDIAIDAADIVIVQDGIRELPHMLALAKRTMRKIRANIALSLTINIVAIVLAAIAVLDPVTGALVHNCGSVFVVTNSAMLLHWKRAA